MDRSSPPPARPEPGRSCPLDYRYGPSSLRETDPIVADVLWVVGGLYGNTEALATLQALVAAETAPRVGVVLNGDFHWFDVDPAEFAAIDAGTAGWYRLRGNVETELARAGDDSAGCGCAYPESVPQADVDRSNAIAARLRDTAVAVGAAAGLGRLPMLATARVGRLRVGIVHGDDRALAGWRLAHDAIDAARADGLEAAFEAADLDLLASSHTCLPVATTFASRATGRPLGVINNGAAGLANFHGRSHGLVTRIARTGCPAPSGAPALYRTTLLDAEVAAIALHFDLDRWLRRFDAQWPAGSAAERSYRTRIVGGPNWSPALAIRGAFQAGA